MSKALWNMAPERRTEPETARLRQVPPVTAERYKKAESFFRPSDGEAFADSRLTAALHLFFVPAEVFAVRRRRKEVVTRAWTCLLIVLRRQVFYSREQRAK